MSPGQCFMNAVLQCLSSTKPLRDYCLRRDFQQERPPGPRAPQELTEGGADPPKPPAAPPDPRPRALTPRCPRSLRRCHRRPLAPRLLRGRQPRALQGRVPKIRPLLHGLQVRDPPQNPFWGPPRGTRGGHKASPPCPRSQQDAQEFLKFFMDRLHVEINRKGRRTPSILSDTRRPPALEDPETLR